MIIDRVGMENVNQTMVRLGLPQTKLQRKMMDSEAWLADRENLSTPNEQARLLELIHRGDVLNDASRKELLHILSIPKSSRIRPLLPSGTRVAHKTGTVYPVSSWMSVSFIWRDGRSSLRAWRIGSSTAPKQSAP